MKNKLVHDVHSHQCHMAYIYIPTHTTPTNTHHIHSHNPDHTHPHAIYTTETRHAQRNKHPRSTYYDINTIQQCVLKIPESQAKYNRTQLDKKQKCNLLWRNCATRFRDKFLQRFTLRNYRCSCHMRQRVCTIIAVNRLYKRHYIL